MVELGACHFQWCEMLNLVIVPVVSTKGGWGYEHVCPASHVESAHGFFLHKRAGNENTWGLKYRLGMLIISDMKDSPKFHKVITFIK